jgi:hypothetical protein
MSAANNKLPNGRRVLANSGLKTRTLMDYKMTVLPRSTAGVDIGCFQLPGRVSKRRLSQRGSWYDLQDW